MSCLDKTNYKTTPFFTSVSNISRIVLPCQTKLQNYTLVCEGVKNLKARRLVLSSQTTKLHLILRGSPKFQDVFSCQAKLQNYTLFRECVQNFKACLVLSSPTTKLHLILRGYPKFQDVLSCQAKLQNYI